MKLDRDVREMLRLELGGRLHLDQVVAIAVALEDVDRGVDVAREERRLVDGPGLPGEKLQGHRDPPGECVVRQVHELAAGHVGPRHLAHACALVEDRLLCGADNQFRRVRLMHAPPQELVALESGREPGLGQAIGAGHWTRGLRA